MNKYIAEAIGTASNYAASGSAAAAAAGASTSSWSSGSWGAWPAMAMISFVAGSTTAAYCSSQKERSFIMVKPDGVNRGLCGEIINRFEQKGYKVVAAKVLIPSPELAKKHYAEHDGKPFFPKLVDFLTSGPVLALVFEGKGAISYGRTLIGATNPLASSPGTIRGDYGLDVGRNIIHGSDSPEVSNFIVCLGIV